MTRFGRASKGGFTKIFERRVISGRFATVPAAPQNTQGRVGGERCIEIEPEALATSKEKGGTVGPLLSLRAANSFVYAQHQADRRVQSEQSAPIGDDIIERAAEAPYEFVFSGCDRLDGKRRWADCSEETKAGFRPEASAVLEAVWPILLPREIKSSQIGQTANWSRVSRAF